MVAEVPAIFVFLPLLVAELHVTVNVLLTVPSFFSIQTNDTVEELENDLIGLLGFNGAEKIGKDLVFAALYCKKLALNSIFVQSFFESILK